MKRIARALESSQRGPAPASGDAEPDETLPLVGRTPAMQRLYRLVAKVTNTDLPVLVSGEVGTGKSLVAQALHHFSDRRNLPFVTVAGPDLAESEDPAGLLARVGGGTLVIEDIGRLEAGVQSRIVRMIDAPGDRAPRFIATVAGDPAQARGEGRVRDDLYYRLSGTTLEVPPLRARVDDIALLCEHFLSGNEADAPRRRFSEAAAELMRAHGWPGNVRQLENTVRGLCLTAQAEEITRAEVEAVFGPGSAPPPAAGGEATENLAGAVARHLRRYFDLHGHTPPPGLHARILREVEAPLIEIALESTRGNQAKCAELLGINRNTLRKKITELDISVTRRRKMM